MNVLVTGGTGFVGREVLRRLHAEGHAIRLLARDPQSAPVQDVARQCNAEVCAGNIHDTASLADACDDMDAVIHLVGIISEVGEQTFENVHTRGTQNLVAAAQRAVVDRFVHMSALGARPNAVSRYHQTKWAAEERVRASGFDWTIFRPSIIYGRGDGFVNLFAKMSRWSPVLPVMGSGKNLFQPVPVADVAACFVQSLTEPKSIGQTYDLCGPERLTFLEVLNAIQAATGRRRMRLHIPLPVARFQADILEFVYGKLLHRAPPLNRDQLLMLQEDNVGNPEAANALFGLKPERFADGIGRYLNPDT